RHRPGRPDDFTEGAIVIPSRDGSVGRVDECHDISIAVIGGKAVGGGTAMVTGFQQAANSTGTPSEIGSHLTGRTMKRAAQIQPPYVGVVQREIAARDQIPAVVSENVRAQGDVAEAGAGGNDPLDAPALPVVGEADLVLRSGAVGYRHLNQSILTVPDVIPAAIAEQVAIQVV